MTNSEPFVPIEDLAKHFNVSISTVRAWIRQEHIPKDTYIKIIIGDLGSFGSLQC